MSELGIFYPKVPDGGDSVEYTGTVNSPFGESVPYDLLDKIVQGNGCGTMEITISNKTYSFPLRISEYLNGDSGIYCVDFGCYEMRGNGDEYCYGVGYTYNTLPQTTTKFQHRYTVYFELITYDDPMTITDKSNTISSSTPTKITLTTW